MRFRPIRLKVPTAIQTRIKRLAREAFPKETMAYVIGVTTVCGAEVTDLWVPEDVAAHCTPTSVTVPALWSYEAHEYAREQDAEVLGDVHSHPTPVAITSRIRVSAELSEGDLDTRCMGIAGVCLVLEGPTGRLRTRLRWWGPSVPVDAVD